MTQILHEVKKIGFIMSPSMGDALIAMIIPFNLRKNGYQVTVFNNFLFALRDWFPGFDIQPWPDVETSRETLKHFDLLLYVYHYNDKRLQASQWHPKTLFLNDLPVYHRPITMADIQVAICQEILGLSDVVRDNGILRQFDTNFRCKPQQVAIHPTASTPDKYWLPERFIALAAQLRERGYQPIFLVSAKEREPQTWIAEHNLPRLEGAPLATVAQCIYESGWFIGCDSGLGHLASFLGIPTVTLMARRSTERRWRPSFAPGKVLLPTVPLLIRSWKKKYWKYFVSVKAVLDAFGQLTKEV